MSETFAQWLRSPHKNLRGTIQQPMSKFKFGYIRPDQFPGERLYFRFADWPTTVLHKKLQGQEVMFDVEPQEWTPDLSANASNVRLSRQDATGHASETRPAYGTRS